eukprot:scaffold44355_cov18-Tisochrysis_lutea.AAC.1
MSAKRAPHRQNRHFAHEAEHTSISQTPTSIYAIPKQGKRHAGALNGGQSLHHSYGAASVMQNCISHAELHQSCRTASVMQSCTSHTELHHSCRAASFMQSCISQAELHQSCRAASFMQSCLSQADHQAEILSQYPMGQYHCLVAALHAAIPIPIM